MITFEPIALIRRHFVQERKDPFEKLPLEMVQMIFDYLSGHDVVLASLVSKKWRYCIQGLRIHQNCKVFLHIIKKLPRKAPIINTNKELYKLFCRYFSKLSCGESGKVICELGVRRQITFQIADTWAFEKRPELHIGMINGGDLSPIKRAVNDIGMEKMKISIIRCSLTTDLLITYRYEHVYDFWAQAVFPCEFEPVFLENFKKIAVKTIYKMVARDFFGCIVTDTHHLIKYGDILPKSRTLPTRISCS